MTAEPEVSGALFALADTLDPEFSPRTHLELLAGYVLEFVEPDAEVGVFAFLPGHDADGPRVVAGSSVLANRLEVIGLDVRDGPGLGCQQTGHHVCCADLRSQPRRWPVFNAAACAHGVLAVESVPVRAQFTTLGAVTIYRHQPGRADSDLLRRAQEFADMAGLGLLQALVHDRTARWGLELQTALDGRIVTEQAKGVLAARRNITIDEAFTAIRDHAQHHNRPINDICHDIVNLNGYNWPTDNID